MTIAYKHTENLTSSLSFLGIFHLQQTWPVFGNDKLVMSMMTDSQVLIIYAAA
jgi:hypothetical protein